MSHFTVTVIGNDVDGQLAPYQEGYEGDLPEEFLKFREVDDEEASENEMEPDPKTGKYGYWYNPNAKWDWYVVGGRWKGYLKLLLPNTGIVMATDDEYRADSAFKGCIDFKGMIKDHVEKLIRKYDLIHSIVNGREIIPWPTVLKKFENVEEARNFYWNQEAMKDLQKINDPGITFGLDDFLTNRKDFLRVTTARAIPTYAYVKDHEWYERGQMGWFGQGSNEKGILEWHDEFMEMINSLPDDELITIVDCHI